ncbi:YqhG family protein [Halobacillus litoralis]|uniref:YqhG family protein n=1 Tax=Halobacillus litoralis TaxID=45668 RepID=UPI001CFCC98B|nr:YqhG family protein [Halobacillus litoralis]
MNTKSPNPYTAFVKDFFTSYGCALVEQTPSYFTIQLTSEMDEEIMNRPFYWHYMKKMNREGDPMQLTFTDTAETHKQGIYLHAGTPKLHMIYNTAIEKARTARLYEVIYQTKHPRNRAMSPWLVINVLLHYRGKQAKDEPLSIGLNLIHGTMMLKMMDKIQNIDFETKVSDYTFPMTPVISLVNAYKRIERHIETYLSSLDNKWVSESLHHLEKEKQLLESFYQSEDIDLESFTKEREQIDNRYKPYVEIEVINGGLFYISQETSAEWMAQ